MDESGRAEGRRKRYDLERHLGQDAHKGLCRNPKVPFQRASLCPDGSLVANQTMGEVEVPKVLGRGFYSTSDP